jgi:hypothetical protein
VDFHIVPELPPRKVTGSEAGSFQKQVIRFLIANPDQWAEVDRQSITTPGGFHNGNPYTRAKALGQFGVHTDVRRDGDDYVIFARLVPGDAA